jgi:hypothetical protein
MITIVSSQATDDKKNFRRRSPAMTAVFGAKVDPSGTITCPPFFVSSILSSESRLDMRLSSTGLALAAWNDGRNDGGDIYAQDIKPDCTLGQ